MTFSSRATAVRSILVLCEEEQPKIALSQCIQVFTKWDDLVTYLCNHLIDVDEFRLHIPKSFMNELVDANIQNMPQVRSINCYCDTDDAGQVNVDHLVVPSKGAEKFEFYPTRDFELQLENDENAAVLDQSGSINVSAVHNIIQSKRKRLREKSMKDSDNGLIEAKRFASTGARSTPRAVMLLRLEMIRSMILEYNKKYKPVNNSDDTRPKPSPIIQVQFDRHHSSQHQDLFTQCLQCPWEGKFKEYQKHCVRYHRAYENDAVGSSVYNNDPVPHLTTTQLTTCDDCNSSTVATTNEYQVYPLEWIMSNEDRFPRRMKHLDIEFLWMIKDFMSKRTGSQISMIDSIVSPEFRSSALDYPMQLHLSPTGSGSTQDDTDIFLSLATMIDNNEVLHRPPVHFEMKVTLVNRSQTGHNQTRYFYFDIESNASQRLNDLIRISNFFSFKLIEPNIHNDTLFIEITLNVLGEYSDEIS